MTEIKKLEKYYNKSS